jgi:hypothetical protein
MMTSTMTLRQANINVPAKHSVSAPSVSYKLNQLCERFEDTNGSDN